MSWGSRGIDEVFENLATTSNYSNTNLFLPEFWLANGESDVLIQIVDEEPFNCFVHSIERVSKNGKPYQVTKTCTGESDCFYCECVQSGIAGVGARMWRAHLTILDSRLMAYSINGEAQDPDRWTRRIWRASSRRIAPLAKNRKIAGAASKMKGVCVLVSRIGTGADTVYTYDVIARKELATASDLSDIVGNIGWDPLKQKFAPCPEIDDVIPFDYEDILKPDTYESAAAFLGKSSGKSVKKPAPAEEDESDEDEEEFERSVSRKPKPVGSSRRLKS